MKQFLDFEEIPKNAFEDLRVKILLEAIEKKELAAARDKQKFIDYCEDLSNQVYYKYVVQYDFVNDDIFELKIYRNLII